MTCLCLDEVVRNTDVKRGAEAGRLWVRGCNSKKTNTRENRNEHVENLQRTIEPLEATEKTKLANGDRVCITITDN